MEIHVINDNEELSIEAAAAPFHPPRWALFVLTVILFATYMGVQLAIALVALVWMIVTKQPITQEMLLESETFIWVSLIALAVSAAVTIGVALIFPLGWRLATSRSEGGPAGWLAWQKPNRLSLWLIPLATFPLMIVVVAGVTWLFGQAEVNAQLLLFSSRSLQIVTTIVVTMLVPLAEEFIFRGALYNTLLSPEKDGQPEWRRHTLPLIVTSVAFALVHLVAGFETIAAIVQITVLSFYLGGLRAVTGSVKASLAAHVTWNLVSAVAMIVATNLNL